MFSSYHPKVAGKEEGMPQLTQRLKKYKEHRTTTLLAAQLFQDLPFGWKVNDWNMLELSEARSAEEQERPSQRPHASGHHHYLQQVVKVRFALWAGRITAGL